MLLRFPRPCFSNTNASRYSVAPSANEKRGGEHTGIQFFNGANQKETETSGDLIKTEHLLKMEHPFMRDGRTIAAGVEAKMERTATRSLEAKRRNDSTRHPSESCVKTVHHEHLKL